MPHSKRNQFSSSEEDNESSEGSANSENSQKSDDLSGYLSEQSEGMQSNEEDEGKVIHTKLKF
jgi:hypothetical protein